MPNGSSHWQHWSGRKRARSPSQSHIRDVVTTSSVRRVQWQRHKGQDWENYSDDVNQLLQDAYDRFLHAGGDAEVEVDTDPVRRVDFLTFRQVSYTRRHPEGYYRRVRFVTE